jgi:ribonuclease Z
LLGRQEPLNIHGLEHTLERVKTLMDLYNWKVWPDFFPVNFYALPGDEPARVIESEAWRVLSYPVCHLIPTIGLRFELLEGGATLAYSSDTEPCPADIALAHHADVLIHEATGASAGHSSAAQAGEVAQEAGVERLYLIHYPGGGFDTQTLLSEASGTFDGPVALAEDFMEIDL